MQDQQTNIPHTDASAIDDHQLMAYVKKDSKFHFRQLVARHLDRVWRVAFRVLEDTAEAEDVTQEVFVTLWQKRLEISEEKGQLASWLYKVAFNKALDVKRSKTRHMHTDIDNEQLSSPDPSNEHVIAAKERKAHLLTQMQRLPESQMQVLLLYYFEDMPVKRISQELGTSEMSVRSLLKRGKKGLRKYYNAMPVQERFSFTY